MKKIIIFMFAIFATATLFAEAVFAVYSKTPDGKEWEFIAGPIDKRDEWDSTVSEHPPLSPRKAKDLAVAFMKSVPLIDEKQSWTLSSISLLPTKGRSSDHWVYVVKFTSPLFATGKYTRRIIGFNVLVRLDGTIPKPEITEKNEIN